MATDGGMLARVRAQVMLNRHTDIAKNELMRHVLLPNESKISADTIADIVLTIPRSMFDCMGEDEGSIMRKTEEP